MAEPPEEGWRVRFPVAARAAVALPATLLVFLALASWVYYAKLRPDRYQPPHTFPAPGLETYVHPGVNDPVIVVHRPVADPQLARAAGEVAREGLPGWPAGAAR